MFAPLLENILIISLKYSMNILFHGSRVHCRKQVRLPVYRFLAFRRLRVSMIFTMDDGALCKDELVFFPRRMMGDPKKVGGVGDLL